ncbi:hypothetical protein STEG23_029341 [Scotinomys teguina]
MFQPEDLKQLGSEINRMFPHVDTHVTRMQYRFHDKNRTQSTPITQDEHREPINIVMLHTFEDENLWIASRLIWFDQPRPPDRFSDVPTSRSASRQLTQKMKPHRLLQ